MTVSLLQRILGDVSDFFNPYHDPATGRFTSTAAGGQVGTVFSKGGHRGVVASTTPFGPAEKPAGWQNPDDDIVSESLSGGDVVITYSKKAEAREQVLKGKYNQLIAFRKKTGIPTPELLHSKMVRGWYDVKRAGVTLTFGRTFEKKGDFDRDVDRIIRDKKKERDRGYNTGPRRIKRQFASGIVIETKGASAKTWPHVSALIEFGKSIGLVYKDGALELPPE